MLHRLVCGFYSISHMFRCAARDTAGVRHCIEYGELDLEGFTRNRHRRAAYRLSEFFRRLAHYIDVADLKVSAVRRAAAATLNHLRIDAA